MNRYSINFKYSNDGKNWYSTSRIIQAESDLSVIQIIKSSYKRVKINDIRRIR